MPAMCDTLYETICHEVKEDNDKCVLILKSDSRITSANNYLDLCTFILEMAIDKATKGQNDLIKLMNTHPTQAIKQCATLHYGGTVLSLRSSMSNLVKDPKDASFDANAAGDGPANCERDINAEKTHIPFINDLNDKVLLLCKIAFQATTHLKHDG